MSEAEIEVLREIQIVLARAAQHVDVTQLESEDAMRERAPVLWAANRLAALIVDL